MWSARIITFYVFLLVLLVGCYSAGPKSRPCIYQGHLCWKDKVYNYSNGKKLHLETLIYKSERTQKGQLISHLVYEKIIYERWPNGDYKKIGKHGFVTFEKGKNRLDDPSIKPPDDLLVPYFDKNLEYNYSVYKNGEKIPYKYGYQEGTLVDVHTGNKPGVYIWQNGELVFHREYDTSEKTRYENALKMIQKQDSVRTD